MWSVIVKTRYIATSPTTIEMYPALVYQCSSVTCRYEIPGETGAIVAEVECDDLVREAMSHDPELLIISEIERGGGAV